MARPTTRTTRRTLRRPTTRRLGIVALALAVVATGCQKVSWLQFGGSPQHGGSTAASAFSLANTPGMEQVWRVTLPTPLVVDSSPVYLADVNTPTGMKDVVYVTTLQGDIFAFDAATGAQLWTRSYPRNGCIINNTFGNCYTAASPAIDPRKTHIYVYGLDGYLHKLAVGDGTETLVNGWPQLITLKGWDEKGSASVSAAMVGDVPYVYMPTSGYPGDKGDYQGHLVTVNLLDDTQKVFNTVCSDQTVHFAAAPATPDCPEVQSAIWGRAGTIYDEKSNRILIATGNANWDPVNHHWGDTVIALNPDGSGNGSGDPVDTYTPVNYEDLDTLDLDLGSTLPALIPTVPGSIYDDIGVMGGKDSKLRLLNIRDLSGQGGPGHLGGEIGPIIGIPQGGVLTNQPAVWINPDDHSRWVFVTNFNGTSAFKVVVDGAGIPSLVKQWQSNVIKGSSPLVAGRVLFVIGGQRFGAYNAVTGAQLFADTTIGSSHFQEPIVANSRLFLPDNFGHLTAYKPGS